jgi:hypothetical protein
MIETDTDMPFGINHENKINKKKSFADKNNNQNDS